MMQGLRGCTELGGQGIRGCTELGRQVIRGCTELKDAENLSKIKGADAAKIKMLTRPKKGC
jgi:hypothetical protein